MSNPMAILRQQLVNAALAEGLIEITYRVIDSPLGRLLLAATEAGIVRVAFDTEDHNTVLQALADTISPRIMEDSRRADPAARQLDEYFAGHRRQFDIDTDLRLVRGYRREVLETLRTVHFGTTVSYGGLANLSGRSKAVRAAASACSHNPIPLVVPCHRVVRSDGSPGDYLGGIDRKRYLLHLEQAHPTRPDQ